MEEQKSVVVLFKNNIPEISRLGDVLEEFGGNNNLPPSLTNSVNLALDELITNTISYGYADKAEHEIKLYLKVDDNMFIASLEDDGKPFNPLERPEVDTSLSLEEKSIGGLGIHLVKKLMDEVDYKYINNKNVLTIKKKIA